MNRRDLRDLDLEQKCDHSYEIAYKHGWIRLYTEISDWTITLPRKNIKTKALNSLMEMFEKKYWSAKKVEVYYDDSGKLFKGSNKEFYAFMMKKFNLKEHKHITEMIKIPVKVGDTILTGRFKNKKVKVKSITYDEYGMPVINGKKATTFRIMKEDKMMKLTELLNEQSFSRETLRAKEKAMEPTLKKLEKQIAGVLVAMTWSKNNAKHRASGVIDTIREEMYEISKETERELGIELYERTEE